MKTIKLNGSKRKLTYRANTGVILKAISNLSGTGFMLGADIYDVEGVGGVAVVATSRNGSDMLSSVTYIEKEVYEKMKDLWEPDNEIPFHESVMSKMGFKILR